MSKRTRMSIAELGRESFRKRMDAIVEKARRRAAAMTPQEIFNARCDAAMARRQLPCIDPEADIDRPGEDEWKDIGPR